MVLTQKKVLEAIARHKPIDLLVEFERPIGIDFVVLAEEIEGILSRKVDLVSRRGVKRPYLEEIEKDIIYV